MNSGKVSESVLKRSVLKYVQQNQAVSGGCELIIGARSGADSALFALPKAGALQTKNGWSKMEEQSRLNLDSSEEQQHQSREALLATATSVAVGRRPELIAEAIINASNNLICSGAEVFGVQTAIVLPEEMYESELKHMMEAAGDYAKNHHITILGGHTEVRAQVTEAVVTVTALGSSTGWQPKTTKPGMDIVMSKWIGLQGTARIISEKRAELEQRFPVRFLAEAEKLAQGISVVPEARLAMAQGVCAMHDVSGGGIFRALWELADLTRTGIRVELRKLPVRQETIEICEIFGLNPYELLGGGALLMVTEDGEGLVKVLWDAGIPAEVIGTLTEDNDKVLLNHSSDGEEIRYLDRPKTDEMDKI